MTWKVGDWVIFDLKIGQIKDLREDGTAIFSDGWIETSGRLTDRFRPLTLGSKRIVETFETYYKRLDEIDGSAGFNYPDISRYISNLALKTIDAEGDKEKQKQLYDKGSNFACEAREYKPFIDGVALFRPRR